MPQGKEAERERQHRDREEGRKVIKMNVENLFYGLFGSMDTLCWRDERKREKNPFASYSNI